MFAPLFIFEASDHYMKKKTFTAYPGYAFSACSAPYLINCYKTQKKALLAHLSREGSTSIVQQFHSNLIQSRTGWREFRFVQMSCHAFFNMFKGGIILNFWKKLVFFRISSQKPLNQKNWKLCESILRYMWCRFKFEFLKKVSIFQISSLKPENLKVVWKHP